MERRIVGEGIFPALHSNCHESVESSKIVARDLTSSCVLCVASPIAIPTAVSARHRSEPLFGALSLGKEGDDLDDVT